MDNVSRVSSKIETLHSFVCAQCGELAATIELVDARGPLAFGPGPLGDELVLNLRSSKFHARQTWLGVGTTVISPELARLLEEDVIDALAVHRLDRNLGEFCCHQCEKVYCRRCWTHWRRGDSILGRCPMDHEQALSSG